ncbi:MAG: DUF2309 domain-containing protein [Sandaracinaceae bacterium]|nr:DUF2309 domain-containing protein [Sandaracinaceae bacterium]
MTQVSPLDTKSVSDKATQPMGVSEVIDRVCARVAPAWPLDRLIAVNPYWGYVDRPIEEAAAQLSALSGTRLTMPREWYRTQLADSTFAGRHLQRALEQSGSTLSLEQVMSALAEPSPAIGGYPTLVDVVDASRDLSHAMSFSEFVTRQVSQTCAAYVDEAQASWSLPRDGGLYRAFLTLLADDASPRLLMGQKGIARAVAALPADPHELVVHALDVLEIQPGERDDYLSALLLSVLGWASAFAFARWEARLHGSDDEDIVHLLAARLAWELLLRTEVADAAALRSWREARGVWRSRPRAARAGSDADWVLQRALEIAYQEALVMDLGHSQTTASTATPAAQLVFCIDVRSEVMRRSIEEGRPHLHTLGFAGFFGLPVSYRPLSGPERMQLPGLLAPSLRIEDQGPGHSGAAAVARRDADRKGLAKQLGRGPLSMFSWVETMGLGTLAALVRDTFALGNGGTDPLRKHPHDHALVPTLVGRDGLPLPVAQRAALAAGVLRGMSLTEGFARVVALFGHAATSDNNPQAAGLQCGACGGQSGEVNARALAGLLNDPAVRAALVGEGINIPESTWFVGGLHDTTTDTLELFDLASLPSTHAGDIETLERELRGASEKTRQQRSTRLGLGHADRGELEARLAARSRDWSEVRPEWGLARNAAFIAAPRARTRGIDLDGRVFLHEYRADLDPGAAVLEQIMCAPMVVAHFINMQYYASTVDNLRYGSGNKVLHNVVGGSVGVFEGAGGDLRIGLALQSVSDGAEWVHVPQRLSVFLEASQDAIDGVITKHELVRNLVENEWLFLFAINPGGGPVHRRAAHGWERSEHA